MIPRLQVVTLLFSSAAKVILPEIFGVRREKKKRKKKCDHNLNLKKKKKTARQVSVFPHKTTLLKTAETLRESVENAGAFRQIQISPDSLVQAGTGAYRRL